MVERLIICSNAYSLQYSWLPLWLSWYRICLQFGTPGFNPRVGKIHWRRKRLPTPVFWPGEFQGLYSPWGHKKSNMAECLSFSFSLPHTYIDSPIINIIHQKGNYFFLIKVAPTLLEKAMAPHSSTLAWKILWMEEPGGLQSTGSLRVGHHWVTSLSLFTFMHWRRKWQHTPVFLPGESQGRGEPGGLPSMGSHRVGHDWRDLATAAATAATLLHHNHLKSIVYPGFPLGTVHSMSLDKSIMTYI